jgi:hypothetical protein
MGTFIGGSVSAMAKEICEGYILISPGSLKKFKEPELRALEQELDKVARDLRGEQLPLDDTQGLQRKSRKLGRVNQSLLVIRNILSQIHKRPS